MSVDPEQSRAERLTQDAMTTKLTQDLKTQVPAAFCSWGADVSFKAMSLRSQFTQQASGVATVAMLLKIQTRKLFTASKNVSKRHNAVALVGDVKWKAPSHAAPNDVQHWRAGKT